MPKAAQSPGETSLWSNILLDGFLSSFAIDAAPQFTDKNYPRHVFLKSGRVQSRVQSAEPGHEFVGRETVPYLGHERRKHGLYMRLEFTGYGVHCGVKGVLRRVRRVIFVAFAELRNFTI
jgi:hypothetical protein